MLINKVMATSYRKTSRWNQTHLSLNLFSVDCKKTPIKLMTFSYNLSHKKTIMSLGIKTDLSAVTEQPYGFKSTLSTYHWHDSQSV